MEKKCILTHSPSLFDAPGTEVQPKRLHFGKAPALRNSCYTSPLLLNRCFVTFQTTHQSYTDFCQLPCVCLHK